MKDPNDYNVRAVERALLILGCFDDENPERGITEISNVVGLHKATAHRIVTTLVNYGFLERATDGQKYRLGLELANLGFKVISRMNLRREALPYMNELVQKWDEACDLSMFDQGQVFYVEVMQGNRALTISAAVGQRLPVHCTASGKLFLAYVPKSELELLLNQSLTSYTDNTITSKDELVEQLEVIRNQGYAVDYEEFELGVCAVAAPIHNSRGDVIAAISCPCPTSRMTNERINQIADSFKEAAQSISHRMGYNL